MRTMSSRQVTGPSLFAIHGHCRAHTASFKVVQPIAPEEFARRRTWTTLGDAHVTPQVVKSAEIVSTTTISAGRTWCGRILGHSAVHFNLSPRVQARSILSRSNVSAPQCGRASATSPASSARSELFVTESPSTSLQRIATGRMDCSWAVGSTNENGATLATALLEDVAVPLMDCVADSLRRVDRRDEPRKQLGALTGEKKVLDHNRGGRADERAGSRPGRT